jgi:hypothetical protein
MAKPKWTLLQNRLDNIEGKLHRYQAWLHSNRPQLKSRMLQMYKRVANSRNQKISDQNDGA